MTQIQKVQNPINIQTSHIDLNTLTSQTYFKQPNEELLRIAEKRNSLNPSVTHNDYETEVTLNRDKQKSCMRILESIVEEKKGNQSHSANKTSSNFFKHRYSKEVIISKYH